MAELDFRALQRSLAAAGNPWRPAETPLSRLSIEEMRHRLGATPPAGEAHLEERENRAAARAAAPAAFAAAAPAAWDWRAQDGKNYLGDPRDQKTCGSCVAFGTVAAIEGTARVRSKTADLAIDLSEAHLFYCHGAAEGRNCDTGWWPDPALDAARDKGIVDEACFPYTPGDQACQVCSDAAQRTTRIKSWTSLTNAAAMKEWIATNGPVATCFTVYEDFYYYDNGIYLHHTGRQLGGHCVAAVGYSDADQCWIMRNSWGGGWGEGGYFRIGYGQAGIDYEMWGVEVEPVLPVSDVVTVEKVLITGLWANADASAARAYVDGVGWRKLPSYDFVALAAAARTGGLRCTLSIKDDMIVEIYVL
jgi:hypothetical protein